MLTSELSADGTTLTITPRGRFDFRLHQAFREAYTKAAEARRYVINLADTRYLDSSTLGMLLLLRERAGGDRSDITIVNCTPDVQKIFTVANFHKLFKLQ